MTHRTVKKTHPSMRDDIADLRTRRPVPSPALHRIGAFLFLNHHGPQVYPPNNHGLPFGPHPPPRGFETVMFVLESELAHRDNVGHESIIGAGDALPSVQGALASPGCATLAPTTITFFAMADAGNPACH